MDLSKDQFDALKYLAVPYEHRWRLQSPGATAFWMMCKMGYGRFSSSSDCRLHLSPKGAAALYDHYRKR